MSNSFPVVAALVAAAVLPSSVRAQGCSGPPNALGTVTMVAATCPSGTGSQPNTTCRRVRVDCTSLPPIFAQVRVTEPPAAVPVRGTVVLGVGGGGVGFYGERSGGPQLVTALLGHGFRIVDRSWESSWFGDAGGVRRQSCRYATLLTWVHATFHTQGAFCATGNSGGSGEICYALSTWGRDAILDVAVPTGGPPMGRLDLLCGTAINWPVPCQALPPAHVMACQPACTVAPTNPVCNSCSSSATAAELRADSILHGAADLDYPATRVHQILGAHDCGSAVPAGLLFHAAVTSEKVLEWAAGTPHWTAETTAGRDAIVRALLGGAACGAHPSTLRWQALPPVGGDLDLDVHGPAGGWFFVGNGPVPQPFEVAPFGWLFLDAPVIVFGGGPLDAVTGRATYTIAIPPDPAFQGYVTWFQALSGSCLTNALRVVIV